MRAKHVSWLALIVLLITSCGVSTLRKQYSPEVLERIDRIAIVGDDIPAVYRSYCIELGLIEVHDNPLYSWGYLEFEARAQAYQRYGDVDMIVRATYDVESSNPLTGLLDPEKYIRGAAIRFNQELKAWYDKGRKEQKK